MMVMEVELNTYNATSIMSPIEMVSPRFGETTANFPDELCTLFNSDNHHSQIS